MLENPTGQRCECCNSHVHVYEENGKTIIECQYCGHTVEDYNIENLKVGKAHE